ncbi:MAG: FAD-dependent oxidoreductase, partial [Pseudomonadota bacterium]
HRGVGEASASRGKSSAHRGGGEASASRGKRVALIGAGPAGLSAASVLARQGLAVTVYEKNEKPGGMLMYGLGEFDLPYEDLKRDTDRILAEGVVIETGVDITSLQEIERRGVDAVLIATGASAASALFEQGQRAAGGASHVTSFMRDVRTGKAPPIGRDAVVEGYGPWALTAARAALRLGARSVTLISPFPAAHDELEEGIDVLAPARVVSFVKRSSRLTALRCARVSFARRDIRGRLLGEKLGGPFTLKSSFYISAMDMAPDCGWAFDQAGIRRGIAGTIQVDPASLMTGRTAVFAAGDVTTGPRSVLSAAAMGVKAAAAMIKFLV